MDILPSGNIFRDVQDIQDTGYFSSQVSIEDQWQQASVPVFYFANESFALIIKYTFHLDSK